jgi:hypothetical protein
MNTNKFNQKAIQFAIVLAAATLIEVQIGNPSHIHMIIQLLILELMEIFLIQKIV